VFATELDVERSTKWLSEVKELMTPSLACALVRAVGQDGRRAQESYEIASIRLYAEAAAAMC
jgi:hypothetical protein